MTTAHAAARLGISPSRIRALISAGRLRAEKNGRDWLIIEADLAALGPRIPGRPRKKSPPEK